MLTARGRRLLWVVAMTTVVVLSLLPHRMAAGPDASGPRGNAAMRASGASPGLGVAIIETHTSAQLAATDAASPAPRIAPVPMAIACRSAGQPPFVGHGDARRSRLRRGARRRGPGPRARTTTSARLSTLPGC